MKINNGIGTIKYQLSLLAVMLVNAALVFPSAANIPDVRFTYHIADYSIAYSARLLVGEILSHFKTAFTFEWLTDFFAVVIVAVAVPAAIYIGSWLGKADKKERPACLVLAFMFATLPYGFAAFSRWAGMLDVYIFAAALLSIAIINVPFLRWLTPALCVAAMMVHPVFAITFFPVIFALMLYRAVSSKSKRSSAALTAVTLLFTAAAAIYIVFFSKSTIKMPMEEMSAYLKTKLPVRDTLGLEFSIYGNAITLPDGDGYIRGGILWDALKNLILFTWQDNQISTVLRAAVSLLPCFAVFNYIWVKAAGACESKAEKLVYAIAVLTALILPLMWIISTDVKRWASLYFLCQFLMLMQLLRMGNVNVKNALVRVTAFAAENPLVLVAAACPMYLVL